MPKWNSEGARHRLIPSQYMLLIMKGAPQYLASTPPNSWPVLPPVPGQTKPKIYLKHHFRAGHCSLKHMTVHFLLSSNIAFQASHCAVLCPVIFSQHWCSVYSIQCVQYTVCTMCTVYSVYSIQCVQCTVYTLHTVHTVHCVQCVRCVQCVHQC